ncbi:uncharacterized protein LOC130725610 [Lotus japonicus]|uniref:uncharacterized protein LOC130725610 n=1 Tax=Lotus japonicus TaxID=34305 RepID=UPI0025907ACD|nr:uncharacterized protein LOC130725610 [Lotus japonicus]
MAATQRRGWSDLQPELLELVLRRLVVRDYLKCRGVCRSWRSIVVNAIKNKCPSLPQFPSLLLIPGKSSSDNKVPATLLDITGNNKQLQLTPSRAWERYFDCVQSKEGWLMFRQCRAIKDNNIYHTLFWIFNPVSGEEYKLPLLPCSPRYNAFTRDIVAISSAPDSQNFLVVVLKCIHHRGDYIQPPLCFCKVNDKSWTRIETNESRFVDIMFLGWKLYAVKEDSVTIFNLKDLNAITTERLVVQLPETNWESQKHWRLGSSYLHYKP